MTAVDVAPARRGGFTPLLLALFAGSGAAALIYEVVWFHLLRLAVGSSAISLAFLLGSFMGGMCLGSLLLPRVLPQRWHPLRVYAALELGIAACGALLPVVLPWLGRVYAEHQEPGAASLVWRGAIAAAALLPPTMLMGATLPAIARWLDATPAGLARLGWFYGANIVGGVAGTLMAGFWLLRLFDVHVATWVAVGINVAVAATALLLALWRRERDPEAPALALAGPTPRGAIAVAVAIALSGCTALGAEVLWTRLLSLLLGASVYTFALILAVFLVGLGAGSSFGARLARRSPQPLLWLAGCQALLPLCIAWSAVWITHIVPLGEPTWIFQRRVYQNMAIHFAWDFGRCLLALLPATVLWGASFPLALAAAAGRGDPGRLVGGLYGCNTIGAILGALGAGLWAIAAVGTQASQQILAVLAGVAALLLLRHRWLPCAACAVATVAGVWLVPAVPPGLIAFGRTIEDWGAPEDYLYVAEGRNASVAVTEIDGYSSFHVSGKVVASTQPIDMRLQRMLGHLPSLVHAAPRRVLVVGCGAAVTAGCFVEYPTVERIVVCEIEPEVVRAARGFFGTANRDVLRDPRTEIVVDDARHFLATTRETFDIITSDPIHPWVRGAAALYSSEYYELVRARLNPGGVVTQWVPLYQTDEAAVKSQLGTFLRAFPGGTLWTSDPHGYDLVVMAQDGPMAIDVDAVQQCLDDSASVRGALAEVELGSAVQLLSTFAGDASTLRGWLADAQLNVDVSLRLQYLAGLSLDVYRDQEIYRAMRAGFRLPDGLFVGDPDTLAALHKALAR